MKELLNRCMKSAISNPAWVCLTWFGMTAGISLLATPVRFGVPSLSRPVALDVSRVVFQALNKAELAALVILLIVVRTSGRAATWWGVCAILALIVIAQSAWLLPELSGRTDLVIQGIEPPTSSIHGIYSALELSKLAILFAAGMVALSERK
jgi:hypothetical protein